MPGPIHTEDYDSDVDPDFSDAKNPYKPPVAPPANDSGFYTVAQSKEETRSRARENFKDLVYIYKYEKLEGDQIRLLKLLPKGPNQELRCRILVKSLAKAERFKYHALSYHWGAKFEEPKHFKIELSDVTVADVVTAQMKGNAIPRNRFIRLHKNLHAALTHLAPKEDSLILWVDAICINQMSILEKTKQVKRMAKIYNSASSVVVWLGPGNTTTDCAMEFIEKIVILNQFDNLIREDFPGWSHSIDGWDALAKLMKIQWFSRRWVVQEIALARRATIHCGNKTVNWQDFSDAVLLFLAKLPQIQDLFKKKKVDAEAPSIEGLGAVHLVRAGSNLARKTRYGDIQEHLVDLEILVSRLIGFDVSTEHDAIYAFLSLARDTIQRHGGNNIVATNNRLNISVEYERPFMDVFIDFTRKCISNSGSLDIICRHWAPSVEQEPKCPSWIKDIKDSEHGTAEIALLGWQARRNGASLVGAPYRDSRKTYNASGNCKAWINLQSKDISEGLVSTTEIDTNNILEVRGFTLGVISNHSGQIKGIINRDWLKHGGWNGDAKDNREVPDKLWRTLVADRDENGENPPGWYGRACYQGLTDVKITGGGQHFETREETIHVQQPRATMLQQYLQRVRNVVWNRNLFLAKRHCQTCHDAKPQRSYTHNYMNCRFKADDTPRNQNGPDEHVDGLPEEVEKPGTQKSNHQRMSFDSEEELFGLGPPETHDGDLVCILAGCSVPVILRISPAITASGIHTTTFYEVVGEAFVYGKMDGEAISGFGLETLKAKFLQFSLR